MPFCGPVGPRPRRSQASDLCGTFCSKILSLAQFPSRRSALGIPAAGFGPMGADEAFWPTPRPPFGLRGLQVAAHLDPGRRFSRLLLVSVADTTRSYDGRL